MCFPLYLFNSKGWSFALWVSERRGKTGDSPKKDRRDEAVSSVRWQLKWLSWRDRKNEAVSKMRSKSVIYHSGK